MTQICQTPCLSLIPYKTWVPSWVLHEGNCHGDVSFPAVGLERNTCTMKNFKLEEGKLTQNLVLFQRVQDLIDRSNFNFKASKLILSHRKKIISFDDVAGWSVPEYMLTCNAVDFSS